MVRNVEGMVIPVFRCMSLAAGVVLTAAIIPPAAHADSLDDQFLAKVNGMGIHADPGALINAGRSSCDTVGTPAGAGTFFNLQGQGLAPPQVYSVVRAAISVYCPDKQGMAPQLPGT